jgi:hypothetical protein
MRERDGCRAILYVDATVQVGARTSRYVPRLPAQLAPLGGRLPGGTALRHGEPLSGPVAATGLSALPTAHPDRLPAGQRRHLGRPVGIGSGAIAAGMEVLDSSPPPVNVNIGDDLVASLSDREPDEGAASRAAHLTAGRDSAFNGPALGTGTDERNHIGSP